MSDAMKLAEHVWETWHGHGAPGDDSIATGVIAALTLTDQADPDGPDPAKVLQASSDADILAVLQDIWAVFWIARPELAFRCSPFADWLNDDPPAAAMVRACAAVARTAARYGVFQLARDTDLIGVTYTTGRSGKARAASGEYYTPLNLTRMMSGMILGPDPAPGQSICDPCAGTGGMFLGAALELRRHGRNPASFLWYGADISRVAIAGLAVNAHAWDLGPDVLIGVADTLADASPWQRFAEEQQAAAERRNELADLARTAALIRQVQGLVSSTDGGEQDTPAVITGDVITSGLLPGTGDSSLLGTWCPVCATDRHPLEFCSRSPGQPAGTQDATRRRPARSQATVQAPGSDSGEIRLF